MKKLLICATLIASFGASASCYKEYRDNLNAVNVAIEESNYDRARNEGAAVAGGLALTTTSTATGGSAMVSTTVGAKLVGALYVGKTWMKIRRDDNVPKLLEDKEALEAAIAILKEARLGNGPYLQAAMPKVWDQVSNDVSLGTFANTVKELDRANAFCPGGEIATPAGIIDMAIRDSFRN